VHTDKDLMKDRIRNNTTMEKVYYIIYLGRKLVDMWKIRDQTKRARKMYIIREINTR
jgi:hypothetical protein